MITDNFNTVRFTAQALDEYDMLAGVDTTALDVVHAIIAATPPDVLSEGLENDINNVASDNTNSRDNYQTDGKAEVEMLLNRFWGIDTSENTTAARAGIDEASLFQVNGAAARAVDRRRMQMLYRSFAICVGACTLIGAAIGGAMASFSESNAAPSLPVIQTTKTTARSEPVIPEEALRVSGKMTPLKEVQMNEFNVVARTDNSSVTESVTTSGKSIEKLKRGTASQSLKIISIITTSLVGGFIGLAVAACRSEKFTQRRAARKVRHLRADT